MTDNPKHRDAQTRVPLSLVPPILIVETAHVYRQGLQNPGRYPFNWRDGGASLRDYIDATERHLAALKDGEWIDEKSGAPHAACVAANMGVILDAKACGKLLDDLHKVPTGVSQRLAELSVLYLEQQRRAERREQGLGIAGDGSDCSECPGCGFCRDHGDCRCNKPTIAEDTPQCEDCMLLKTEESSVSLRDINGLLIVLCNDCAALRVLKPKTETICKSCSHIIENGDCFDFGCKAERRA